MFAGEDILVRPRVALIDFRLSSLDLQEEIGSAPVLVAEVLSTNSPTK